MKEIKITAKRQKTELKWIAACFGAAFLLNAMSIIIYDTLWSEIYTQWLWVALITGLLYAFSALARGLYHIVKRRL